MRLVSAVDPGTTEDIIALVQAEFPGEGYRVEDLFADELRRVIGFVLNDRVEEYQTTFALLAARDADVLTRLGRMHGLIPAPMRVAASVVLDLELSREIRRLQSGSALREMQLAVESATVWGYRPERERLRQELAEELQKGPSRTPFRRRPGGLDSVGLSIVGRGGAVGSETGFVANSEPVAGDLRAAGRRRICNATLT